MQEVTRKRAIRVGMRARFPLVARAVAILILTAAVAFIAISYYRLRNNKPFRMLAWSMHMVRNVVHNNSSARCVFGPQAGMTKFVL